MDTLWQEIKSNSEILTIKNTMEGMDLFQHNGYAYFGTELAFFSQEKVKSLAKFEDFVTSFDTFGLQKDSEFLDIFNHHLVHMLQGGILDKLLIKWKIKKGYEMFRKSSEADPIPLDSLKLPASLFMGGLMCSFISICFELLVSSSRFKDIMKSLMSW